jgi:hypothetical protein
MYLISNLKKEKETLISSYVHMEKLDGKAYEKLK